MRSSDIGDRTKALLVFIAFVLLSACGSSTSDASQYLGIYSTGGGGSSAITLTTSCTRTSGLVPLAISFNTIGSVSTNTSPASDTRAGFHQIGYTWDFGDPSSGTWTYGAPTAGGGTGNSRNAAYGPVAAHVFDTAGTYTVQVTANDGSVTKTSTACIVTANAWPADTTTTCIGASTLPVAGVDGCPSGAAVATQSDMSAAATTYCTADGKRILFKHDDTFTGSPTLSHACEINMYGSGAKPINSGGTFTLSGNDSRLVNIAASGGGSGGSFVNIGGGASIANVLIYKSSFSSGAGFAMSDNATNTPPSGTFIVDNVCNQCASNVGSEGFWLADNDSAVMGNDIIHSGGGQQHTIRMMYAERMTINNNTLTGAGNSGKEEIAIRAMSQPYDLDGNGYIWATSGHAGVSDTAYIEISDNEIAENSGTYGIELQRYCDDCVGRDYIVERNYFHTSGTLSKGVENRANWATVRDNIIDCSHLCAGGDSIGISTAITFTHVGPAGTLHGGWVYNNTIYSSTTDDGHMSTYDASGTGMQDVTIKNNLGYAPSGTSSFINITAVCTANCTASNNSTNTQYLTGNPSFTNGSGLLNTPLDFKPTANDSPGDTTVPVWADFFQTTGINSFMGAIHP